MDPHDEAILYSIYQNKSMIEMKAIGLKSTSTILDRIRGLEERGYVVPPAEKNQPRGRKLTEQGVKYLLERGYTTNELARIYQAYHAHFS